MGSSVLKKILPALFLLSIHFSVFSQNKVEIKVKYLNNAKIKSKIELTANNLFNEINDAAFAKRKPEFSTADVKDTCKENILSIWETKPFICPEPQLFLPAIRVAGGSYEIRGIPLLFGKTDDPDKSFEEGVLVFTDKGELINFYLGLPENQYKQLMSGVDIQDLKRRQIILDFVENFRTSYNRKDLNLLEKVFSDNALIIVGNVVKEKSNNREFMNQSLGEQKVELIRLNKRQYLDGLKKVFDKNSFIKVGFDDIQVYQHKSKPDFYGVNMVQNWSSSGYSDSGFLFLLIDFRNENEPLVWVRAWQPSEFTKKEEMITLDQFILQ